MRRRPRLHAPHPTEARALCRNATGVTTTRLALVDCRFCRDLLVDDLLADIRAGRVTRAADVPGALVPSDG